MPNRILKTPTLHYVEEIVGATNSGVSEIPLTEVDLSNTQFEYRLDPDLALLIDSIKKDGQQIPVIVRGQKPPYQLICGFRRTRSIREIGGQTVKAIILPDISDDKAHRLSVLENEERKSLSDLDRANACKRLQEEGKTQEEIARIMNCSQPKISRYISLLSLPAPVYQALKDGRINTVHALALKDSGQLFSAEYLTKLITEIAGKISPAGRWNKSSKMPGTKKSLKNGHTFSAPNKVLNCWGFPTVPICRWMRNKRRSRL